MLEFGKTLRDAREAKGLSIGDIANRTRMMASMVSDLENEDFSRLPAPIYGRGFIKLYSEAVGIDPAPLIAEFNEIINGNREPAIRERVVAPEPPPEPPPENTVPPVTEPAVAAPKPVTAPEPPRQQLDLFSAPATIPEEPATREEPVLRDEPADLDAPKPETPAHAHDPVFSRYATPLRDPVAALPRIAPALGRWCVVAVVLAILLGAIAVGIRALYRATRNPAPPAEEPRPTANASATKTDRSPIDVPPLYID